MVFEVQVAGEMGDQLYDLEFFARLETLALRSAEVVVPILLDFIRPRSVVDVGCGTGAWLSVFMDHGVDDVLGIDGDYVDRERLLIPPDRFLAADLANPLNLDRRFDLVLSLEVAEHLPEMAAEGYVESLTRLGSTVLFSAAIPGQGGTNHVNEQWPEYWAGLFETSGFFPVDYLRDKIWDNKTVAWWYAQNAILYCCEGSSAPGIKHSPDATKRPSALRRVHPRLESKLDWDRKTRLLRETLVSVSDQFDVLALAGFEKLSLEAIPGLKVIPFTEREGRFFGYPGNVRQAISELERMRLEGVDAVALAWSASWLLSTFPAMMIYLREHYRVAVANEAVEVWENNERPPDEA
ncbi:MAG TPA: class I SAM-dependent methyltransferase [Rhodothermales bacterium]|nr:class I SAM-dependent methyltransferase [Rhodothermales bacterium]